MFGRLKDKLKGWVKDISSEELEEDSINEEENVLSEVEEVSKEVEKETGEELVADIEGEKEEESGAEVEKEQLKAGELGGEDFDKSKEEKELEEKIKKNKEKLEELERLESGKVVEENEEKEFGEEKTLKEKELEEKIKKDKEELERLEGVDIKDVFVKNDEGKVVVDVPVSEIEKSIFKKIKSSMSGKIVISESDFDKYQDDLEMILLENNVAMDAVSKILDDLRERVVGVEILKKELETNIKINLREIIENILVEPYDVIKKIKDRDKEEPYVILFCGINGAGKTTTIAKFVKMLGGEGLSCVLAAGDTFRAASIEQLKVHGDKLNTPVIAHDYGSDPAAVGYDTIKYAKKNKVDCVLIDTAGRMHTAKNLMAELEKVARVCKPDLKIFLGESIAGNDSVSQIKAFDEAIDIDGIVLSKADIDEKGGTALSVGFVTGKPILYLGVGQEYSDLEEFDKLKFVESLGL